MAEKLDIPRTTYWRYEAGKTECEPDIQLRLARLASDNGRPDLARVFLAPFISHLGISAEPIVRAMRRSAA